MTQTITNNEQFGKHLALWIGRMQRLNDSFQMLIVPVPHAKDFQSIVPVIETLPSYLPPAKPGFLEYNAGFFALNQHYNVDDAIAEIHAGNITFEARNAAMNSIAAPEEIDTFDMNTPCCPFPIDRKAFASTLGLPLQRGPYRTYQLHYCVDIRRGHPFLIVTRTDQPLVRVGLTEPLLSDVEKELFIENADGAEKSIHSVKLKCVRNGRELHGHSDFQTILSYLRLDQSYIAEMRHGDFRLQL